MARRGDPERIFTAQRVQARRRLIGQRFFGKGKARGLGMRRTKSVHSAGDMNRTLDLEAIESLDAIFEQNGIDYWLFGGWAVDFHAGRMTRDHADIDIAIWRTDAAKVAGWLVRTGWAHEPGAEQDGYTTYTRDGVHVDLAFLARDEEGTVYTPLQSGRGDWPPGSFGSDVRRLAGIRASVVTVASLIADKSQVRDDPTSATKDGADVAVLQSLKQ
jgi:hypothetical protein